MRQRPQPVTADEVGSVTFMSTQFREGYDTEQVDAFLQRVHEALVAKDAGRPWRGILTPETVLQQRFGATKFRLGYDQDEVDDLLDRVIITLRPDVEGASSSAAHDLHRASSSAAHDLHRASSSAAHDLHPAPTGVRTPFIVALVLVGITVVILALVL